MLVPLLSPGNLWTLVGGKGGVGKTTTAAALAVEMADAGEPVLLLSVDPAHSLGDALGQPLGAHATPVSGVPGLEAMEVDAEHERGRFLSSNRGRLLRLIERGTYLDEADAAGFVDLAVPGMDEIAALLRLLELAQSDRRRVVLDTAPTGHTQRLLELPGVARGWLAALQAMEDRHRAIAGALAGAVRVDDVGEMLASLDRELAAMESLIRDPARTRFVLVSTDEPVVLAETRRFQQSLTDLGIALAGIVVNRAGHASPAATGMDVVFVPRLGFDPTGLEGLRRFSAAAAPRPGDPGTGDRPAGRLLVGGPFHAPPGRLIYLVVGKGGVGKSTVACALAVRLAEADTGGVLLLGTDPAGSIGDVLGVEVGAEARPVPGVPGLRAQELDPTSVWAEFREEYRSEAERLFERLLGGLSAEADRRVVERLIDLAPPGLDELMALLRVVELIEHGSGHALVLDTAPTGHLLRLLEMPAVALAWSHSLLRLLLKYREVIGLGELAQRVLHLARSLRALRELLADPERSWVLVVALPEALSVPETARLVTRLREIEVPAAALLINRLLAEGEPLIGDRHAGELVASVPGLSVAGAPLLASGPCGVDRLREFAGDWRAIELAATAP